MISAKTEYSDNIATLLRELGIPRDYGDQRKLSLQPEASPGQLTTIALKPNGTPIQLLHPAANEWHRLHDAALSAGISLVPLSGFRSVARQATIIRRKLEQGGSIRKILTSVAAPGYSEHHSGRALDLGTPEKPDLEEEFAETPAYHWLQTRAADWGFHLSYPKANPHGIVFEPWHWCWGPP